MKQFISDNFLLQNRTAERLYHKYAANQPVIDFHCHLSPAMIAEDRRFNNLTQAWLEGDHYKWRAMRANGIDEHYITGDADDAEKFMKWAETVPAVIGNPLYHWTHLELTRYFDITKLLSPATAERIYRFSSEKLATAGFSTRALLKKMNAEIVCTTDDPADSLEHHRKLKGTFEVRILPTFRPDNIIKTDNPETFRKYIKRLEESTGSEITGFGKLVEALDYRHSYFHENGCRISDHGIDRFYYADFTLHDTDTIFLKLIRGNNISAEEKEKYITAIMLELCRMNHKRGWTQQFHAGALRNNNERMFNIMGPDTGWDSIGRSLDPVKISHFLNALEREKRLARTILYNLNPADNEMLITMAGNFNDGTIKGKVQYGSAWWFLDQRNGIEKQLRDLSSLGSLRWFVGMVTDSRSFLSYPRHEYFRRILCNWLGEEVEKRHIPDDEEILGKMVEDISYGNARDYLGLYN
ncbi:MAG TPA: glucuronate isomerase [Bacteroidales bacterium]|nr:glucuronate isomerase [Bacteroidales bacterium]